jgi:multicomponent Na+:H+ antiporter subunit D
MKTLTLIWITIPFFLGFMIYLFPKLERYFALAVAINSIVYSLLIFNQENSLTLELMDNFGVTLVADNLSGFFILTNALVTLAVILYCWTTDKTPFFYAQTAILHGSVNATFICEDFISLYVALEVLSIAAFLAISYPRSDRSLWVALRYLFVSNTVMLFYLIGAVLVYKEQHSFHFSGLQNAAPEAIALILLGLLTKGGIFISGLWLPLTHSESESQTSALMSGAVVKAAVFPLARCALMFEDIEPIIRFFGVGTALLGVFYAIFETDIKRMLAFSTVSQLGFILAAPNVGGFYALTHGMVKAALFMIAGILPSRNLQELRKKGVSLKIWIPLVIASFSISGFPLLAGFGAKVLTLKNLVTWQVIGMNVAALGTVIAFAKVIFLPRNGTSKELTSGFWQGVILLLMGLIIANGVYYDAYTLENTIKPLVTIAIGWLIYWLFIRRLEIKLPRMLEQFDHLIGMMCVMLIVLLWMTLFSNQFSVISFQ